MEEKTNIKENKENIKLTNSSTTEIKEDFKLKIDINKWEQKTNKATKKLEVIFNVELHSELSSKKWNVFHSIQDFKDLINNLSHIFPNLSDIIPNLKPLEKELNTSSTITKASLAIVEFFKSISHRSDIINSKYYIDFFKLENHFGDLIKNEPEKKFSIDGLNYEISDMILLEKKDILIVGCSQINNNVLSKMNFWNKKVNKGQLNVYNINHNEKKETGDYLFAQVDTESEISCLCATKDMQNILVGYFNGTIELFELPEHQENKNEIIKLIPKNKIGININKNRIINIGYNISENSFYCACYKDIMIYNAKILGKNLDMSLPGSDEDLCGFYYKEKFNNFNDLVLEIDIYGKIYIGTINKFKRCIDFIYVLDQKINQITLFKVDLEFNHIYVGNKSGTIDIFSIEISQNENNILSNNLKIKKILNTSLNNDNKGKLTNMILRNFPNKINDICYNPKKKEIYIALDNGTIQVYSHFKNFPEFVIYEQNFDNKKENEPINKLYFSKLNSILYVGRSEKDICVYQMPDNYNSEISRRLQGTNSFEILDGNKICKNSIEQGYPNNTQSFKRKSFINLMGVKNYDN
jgi:hypothetical protein